MNALPRAERSASRLAALLLVACTVLALANLPGDDLPPAWLLAFVVPAAVFAQLMRFSREPWLLVVTVVLLQGAACWLALELAGPMSRPAALACTILPPLGFATARHHDADQALALFLSFCVVLVGAILDGLHLPLVCAYGVFACLSLRCTNHLAALAASRTHRRVGIAEPPRSVFGGTGLLVLGSLLAAFAIERTLNGLPSPSREAGPGAGSMSEQKRVGLDDSFLLDGTRGLLPELSSERLVRVRSADGSPLAANLYLRSGFFTVAGLDRWQLGTIDPAPIAPASRRLLNTPAAGFPVQRLECERYAGARNFVFVPPASCAIDGLSQLVVDPLREWVRQQPDHELGVYTVSYQVLPPLTATTRLDPSGRALGLLALPRDLVENRYAELLDRWQVGEGAAALAGIAEGLARHCRYERIEPVGPWPSAIDNFLFAVADRRGYCMHFASAAALLLRLRGVPCRIGVGLYGGDAEADGTARLFGAQHAHAWVEIPVADRGYTVFDPTPAAERGQRAPSRVDTDVAEPPPEPEVAEAAGRGLFASAFAVVAQPWLLPLLLAIAIAAAMWPRRPAAARAAALPANARNARRSLLELLHALGEAGHARLPGQTLEAFAGVLSARQQLLPEIRAALAAYQQVRFDGQPFDAAREHLLRAGLVAARAMPRANVAPADGAPSVTAAR